MKTKKEIEQLSLLKYPKFSSDPYNPEQDDEYYERLIWVEGYTQCQKDMVDNSINFAEWLVNKYIMIHDKKWNNKNNEYDETDYTTKQLYDIFINSLNKKD